VQSSKRTGAHDASPLTGRFRGAKVAIVTLLSVWSRMVLSNWFGKLVDVMICCMKKRTPLETIVYHTAARSTWHMNVR